MCNIDFIKRIIWEKWNLESMTQKTLGTKIKYMNFGLHQRTEIKERKDKLRYHILAVYWCYTIFFKLFQYLSEKLTKLLILCGGAFDEEVV